MKDLILYLLISVQALTFGTIYFTNESDRIEDLEYKVKVLEIELNKTNGKAAEAIKFCNWSEIPVSQYVANNRTQILKGNAVKYPTWKELKKMRIDVAKKKKNEKRH